MVETLGKRQAGLPFILILMALVLMLPSMLFAAPVGEQEAPVVWVVVKGEIDQGQAALVKRAVELADREQAQ